MKDLVGQTLGYYRIEASLGLGGMGQVFRGKHIYLDRPAAIKVMHEHLASNEMFRSRFIQEAKSTAALKHPHIVEIYEFGQQDGLLYLVMELLTDGTLSTLIREHTSQSFDLEGQDSRLIVELDLVRQAAGGLGLAHEQGVIHRDIKPDNLLIKHLSNTNQQGEQYQLKISDFGLARLVEGSSFSAGGPVGTPAYMSPEQCLNQKLDGRSDLYSLGVVLYEAVTGTLPFQINTFSDAVHKHVHVLPLQGGESLPLRQVRPNLPPIVEQIILRCLAKAPEVRYQTGNELAEALQDAINQISSRMAPSIPPSLFPPQEGARPLPYKAPRIRIFQNGQPFKTVEVTRRELTIGRQNDCDVMLSAEAVSRLHLKIMWDGKQITVMDLKSSNGTRLGNEPLVPHVSRVWNEQQTISIGHFLLRLEGGTTSLEEPKPANNNRQRPVQPPYGARLSDRIGIRMEPAKLTITPGQPTATKITVMNLSQTSDWFTVRVEGVPQAWTQWQGQTQGHERSVFLNPGMQESLELHINIAKIADNWAREYQVTIRVSSRNQPNEPTLEQASWTVLPFWEHGLVVQPNKATGCGTGNYTILLHNNGNTIADYQLSGERLGSEADRRKLTYHFKPNNTVTVEPGGQIQVPLQVKSAHIWLIEEQQHNFLIRATPTTKRNNTGLAETGTTPVSTFINKALLPQWALLLILVSLCIIAATIVAAFLIISN